MFRHFHQIYILSESSLELWMLWKIAQGIILIYILRHSVKLGPIMLILGMWSTGGIASRMIDSLSGISSLNWHNGHSVPKHAGHDALQVFYRDLSRYLSNRALAAHMDSLRDHPSYWLPDPRLLLWLPHLRDAFLLEKGNDGAGKMRRSAIFVISKVLLEMLPGK